MSEVIVVGGGVSGLTTATVLAERGHRVRVWSREPAATTTSAVAGALWWPYRIEPRDRVGDWSLTSLRWYEELAGRPHETGVRLVAGVHRGERLAALGPWAAQLTDVVETAEGLRCRLPLLDMPAHLEWLENRVRAAGGSVERRKVNSFDEAAAEAATVVNCTGLGARALVPDAGMRSVRGQLVLVENPGIDEWFTEADPSSSETTYFFPQPGRLVLGGTAGADDWSTVPNPRTAQEIVARCARIRPEIARARVIGHRVGLRPAREAGVRIEAEALPGGGRLVHNYGHGGAGVTVALGCAEAAAQLVG
ncbi:MULTISPECIES: FAD-dependent oxidoreductase [unclassified Streptomyces]|uniref:FAD-dependent oxidoreductase n=1 Tax=unclassified Streptomyces TaxID=2593676 RepID=UPI00225107C3|nr:MULTISPECIES: FAD-dependent oxidoreductase [unclassified Streptomyces]MCX5144371.1 FAD-binding oxidoreductase [Streptomyces sp. NBC_00338]WRZ68734.1 FAD-binding oxidoreductase [Streptomyces sp. NBC_01257]WSU62694.1 FAD-binding oxidoreductase [Streptomyces sp. NBC_01104]